MVKNTQNSKIEKKNEKSFGTRELSHELTATNNSTKEIQEELNVSRLEQGTHANQLIPFDKLGSQVDSHTSTDEEKSLLSKSIESTSLNFNSESILAGAGFGNLLSKISGNDLEKDVKVVQNFSGNESELGDVLDKFERIDRIKDRIENSFFGKISGFFGKKPEFNPDDFLTEEGKMKTLGKYVKGKVKSNGVMAAFGGAVTYGMVRKFEKALLIYRPAKKIIESIGGVVKKVTNLGAKASGFLEKFKPSREKLYMAQKMVTSAPKMIASFLKTPKKKAGEILEFLQKGNATPGFAEKLKEKKIKGFQFRGSGPAMIAILSQKVISEMVEDGDLENPESFSEKWVPGVALVERDLPNLLASIEKNGIMNSKTELAGFILQAGFDIATVWAIVAFVIAGAPAALAVGVAGAVALRTGGLFALKKLIGTGMKKYGQKFSKNKSKKAMMKQGFFLGGPAALNVMMASMIPMINKKAVETVQTNGAVVAQKIFTPQQLRAAKICEKMKKSATV